MGRCGKRHHFPRHRGRSSLPVLNAGLLLSVRRLPGPPLPFSMPWSRMFGGIVEPLPAHRLRIVPEKQQLVPKSNSWCSLRPCRPQWINCDDCKPYVDHAAPWPVGAWLSPAIRRCWLLNNASVSPRRRRHDATGFQRSRDVQDHMPCIELCQYGVAVPISTKRPQCRTLGDWHTLCCSRPTIRGLAMRLGTDRITARQTSQEDR